MAHEKRGRPDMLFTFKKKKEAEEPTEIVLADAEERLTIPLEQVTPAEIPDQPKLVEITDSAILGHVDALIPGLVKAGTAAAKAATAAHTDGTLYRVVIPSGTTLVASKEMPGAFRGFVRDANGIKAQANLVPETSMTKTGVMMNTVASAMAVASMVVGQYYMNQINGTLDKLNGDIEKITRFQDNEYKSKVSSLVKHVMSISSFQMEIIENDEARRSRINHLDALETSCTELLDQAKYQIDGLINNPTPNYDAYEEKTADIQRWYDCQNILYCVLCEISELRYTLYLGEVSKEQCGALLPCYEDQMKETQERLSSWHRQTKKRLGVNPIKRRRKKQGAEGALFLIPGKINEDLKYKSIPDETAKMIDTQAKLKRAYTHDSSELYSKEVALFSKDGRLYYLPEGE